MVVRFSKAFSFCFELWKPKPVSTFCFKHLLRLSNSPSLLEWLLLASGSGLLPYPVMRLFMGWGFGFAFLVLYYKYIKPLKLCLIKPALCLPDTGSGLLLGIMGLPGICSIPRIPALLALCFRLCSYLLVIIYHYAPQLSRQNVLVSQFCRT